MTAPMVCTLTSDQITASAPALICDQQTGRRAGSLAYVYYPHDHFANADKMVWFSRACIFSVPYFPV